MTLKGMLGSMACGSLASLAMYACSYVGPACQVVDAAHDVCVTVRFIGSDGRVHEVQVPQGEVVALGQRIEAQRARILDGGGAE